MTEPADDELWSAVADPSRRRIVDLLVRHGEATPSSLASEVPFSRQAVSKHLAVLEAVGLVRHRRLGREVRYRVVPARLYAAAHAMTQVADDWDRRLTAIKRLAEATHAGSEPEATAS